MESNIKDFNRKRIDILDHILEAIRKWDKTYEMGIDIIDTIDLRLEELKAMDREYEKSSGPIPLDEAYRDKMTLVAAEYEELLEKLEVERKKLLELIQETKLKDKVKNSYILKEKESVFIDKDL